MADLLSTLFSFIGTVGVATVIAVYLVYWITQKQNNEIRELSQNMTTKFDKIGDKIDKLIDSVNNLVVEINKLIILIEEERKRK